MCIAYRSFRYYVAHPWKGDVALTPTMPAKRIVSSIPEPMHSHPHSTHAQITNIAKVVRAWCAQTGQYGVRRLVSMRSFHP